MRVKVFDLCGIQAACFEHGQQLHDLIEPAIARGEEVVLDFEGVRWFNSGFFAMALGPLIVKDTTNRLGDLLRYENLAEMGRLARDGAVNHWTRRRDVPGYGEGWDAAARRYSEQWE